MQGECHVGEPKLGEEAQFGELAAAEDKGGPDAEGKEGNADKKKKKGHKNERD